MAEGNRLFGNLGIKWSIMLNWMDLKGKDAWNCTSILPIRLHGVVRLSLCLTKHHAIKRYWGVEV
jgi:hypothetical protein